jgi:octaprenyl-diphosphate synthase
MTMPVIFAYARGSDEERRFWQDAIAGFRTEDEDFAHAVDLIRRHDAIAATRERARHFAQRACDALAIFRDGRARAAMIEAAQFAVSRGY